MTSRAQFGAAVFFLQSPFGKGVCQMLTNRHAVLPRDEAIDIESMSGTVTLTSEWRWHEPV